MYFTLVFIMAVSTLSKNNREIEIEILFLYSIPNNPILFYSFLFLSYSYSIPILFLFYSYSIPILFLSYPYSIPILFLSYSYSIPNNPIPILFLFYSYSIPILMRIDSI